MAQKLYNLTKVVLFGVLIMISLALYSGCIVPDPIESSPQQNANLPPIIESFSPDQSYVILRPGEEKIFSINKVKDEHPESLHYLWYYQGEEISNGTFLRFVAPPLYTSKTTRTTEYHTLKVVISDGKNETQWWWTIIITAP